MTVMVMESKELFNYSLDVILNTNSGIAVILVDGFYKQVFIKRINQHAFKLITDVYQYDNVEFKGKISDLEMLENEQGVVTFVLKKFEHEDIFTNSLFPDGIIKFKICEFI